MKSNYDIHPDFTKFPVLNFKFSPWLMWLINLLMKLQRVFARRSADIASSTHTVSSSDGSQFQVTVMTPHGLKRPAPALLYYHGGAFAMSYAGVHLANCERYALEARCIVIFVDYRLAPKHPFPSGFEDSYAALGWTIREASALGVDCARIAVGGDSAGGALAAGVAHRARDEQLLQLCAQLLIYPVLDNRCATPSATQFVDVPVWNAISNRRMWEMYLSRFANTDTPTYAAPGLDNLHELPLTFVETAEFDPLRDEGLNHARALRERGTEVVVNETQGTVHGYDANSGNEITQASMSARVAFLQRAFGKGAS